MAKTTRPTRPGDWIEVHSVSGGQPRRGQILEVRGRPGHEHYRVRWNEERESVHFPAQGTRIIQAPARDRAR
jgi:hypothetical protein